VSYTSGVSKKKRVETEPAGQLTHNPFAALSGVAAEPADAPARAPEDAPRPSAAAPVAFGPKVVVRREKKGRGGKTVTRITGIATPHRAPMAVRMKKALGCGAQVQDEDVLLLGSLVDRAADWLEAEGAPRVVRSS
jgi:translation initiation factor 1